MSKSNQSRMLSEKEIENLANSQAEREAFIKSSVVFVVVWLAGFLTVPLAPERHHYILDVAIPFRAVYIIVWFFVAFFAGLLTRWIVKESAYEKYYILYTEQQKQRDK